MEIEILTQENRQMKVRLTRDIDDSAVEGDVCFWDIKACIYLKEGLYDTHSKGTGKPCLQIWATEFKSLFGFTPRKGTNKTYDITLTGE